MSEKISVIITTYKREMDILRRALDSVYRQTYKNIEVIVVNDYPEYRNRIDTVAHKYSNIKVFHNERNMGACYARNRGIEESDGEFIAFLDDDDTWNECKLEHQLKIMKDDIAMVYCTGVIIHNDGGVTDLGFIKEFWSDDIMECLTKENCIGGMSVPLIRRCVLLEVGGFDVAMKSSQDYDLWIRIAQKHKIAFLNEKLVNYYISEDSITSDFNKRINGWNTLLRKHRECFNKYPASTMGYMWNMLRVCRAQKKYFCASLIIVKSFRFFPHNVYRIKQYICKSKDNAD